MAEVLRCMITAGVDSLWVETDVFRNTAQSLYEAMGFTLELNVKVLRKEY